MTRDLPKLHTEALERFTVTADAEEKQRKRELEDLRFADPIEAGDQWTKLALSSRDAQPAIGNLPAVPARPALTINKLRAPLQQVQNQQRQARLSLSFAPTGDGAALDVAEAFEDIVRAIQADSRAHLARNWAFDRGIRCGRGFYRIETDYVSDRSFDQQIVYKRILNQFSVYFYPFCQEPDYSDALWCFITEDMPWVVYKRMFGKSDLANYNDDELTAVGNDRTGWVNDTEAGKTIRVAEYYFFEEVADTLVAIRTDQGPQAVLKSELGDGFDDDLVLKGRDGKPLSRPVVTRQLRWAKLNGVEFLKEVGEDAIVERDGRYIPVVPFIADESNLNGDRRYTGMVRPAIDAQRLFNVEASSLAEAVHLGPVAPFIGFAKQFEGYEAWWAQLNTRRFPFLPVNPPETQFEAAMPLPQRNTNEQPIQAIALSLQQAGHYIDATTGVPPASLGAIDPHERSGKAVLALQKQAELGTAGYIDNLASMSMLLEGKILRDLIPRVYDRPGRMVAAQGDDDERRMLLLNAPYRKGPQGEPQPVPAGTPNAKIIDLAKGEYAVAVTVGKSYTTRREEAASMMGELAQAVPGLVPAFADLWVKNMDGPGFRQIADRLAKAVPPQFQEQDDQGIPPQLQGVFQQLQAENQQLKQVVATDSAKEQIKQQATLQKAQIDADKDIRLQQMRDATAIRVAQIAAAAKGAAIQQEYDSEAIALAQAQADRTHEHVQNELDRQHDERMAERQHQQALEAGAVAHDQELESGAVGHQQALEQGAQAAALKPAPSANGSGA